MLKPIVIRKIVDSENKKSYEVGDRVRVLLESASEYIGTITDIFCSGFSVLVNSEEKLIYFNDVDKIRLAEPGENFYNRFNF